MHTFIQNLLKSIQNFILDLALHPPSVQRMIRLRKKMVCTGLIALELHIDSLPHREGLEWTPRKRRKEKPKKMASSLKGEKASLSFHCLSIRKKSEGPLHTALTTECGQRALK